MERNGVKLPEPWRRANGNLSKAADLLGISRPTLYDLLNRFGLRKQRPAVGEIAMRSLFACGSRPRPAACARSRIDVAVVGMSQRESRSADRIGARIRDQRRSRGRSFSLGMRCNRIRPTEKLDCFWAGLRCRRAIPSVRRNFERPSNMGSPEVVLPPLARAMLEQGEAAKLVAEFGDRKLTDIDAEASLRSSVGHAQLQLQKFGDAAASFSAATALKPDYLPARLGVARLMAAANRIDDANQLIDAIVAAHPKAAEAHALQSDLRLLGGDRAGAKTSLEQAIAADESFLPARFALIQLLISEKQFDAAAALQLDTARSLRKG